MESRFRKNESQFVLLSVKSFCYLLFTFVILQHPLTQLNDSPRWYKTPFLFCLNYLSENKLWFIFPESWFHIPLGLDTSWFSLYGLFLLLLPFLQNKNKPAFSAAYFYLLFFNYLSTAAPTKPTINPTANATDILRPPFIRFFSSCY